ncbi:MAG: oligoendopeptidase F [Christensenellales bacterium]
MKELKNRSEMNPAYMWKLEDIYPSDTEWEEDFLKGKAEVESLRKYKDTLTRSPEDLYIAAKAIMSAQYIVEKLFVYARMRRDEDNANPTYQSAAGRAMKLLVTLEENTAFVAPSLLSLSEDTLESWYRVFPALTEYRRYISTITHLRAHTLDEKGEMLLARAAEVAQGPHEIFTMLNDVDMKYGTVHVPGVGDVELTHGRYIELLENPNREVRREAYTRLYAAYIGVQNTLSEIYSANIKGDNFMAFARHYDSALEMALFPDKVTPLVYNNLIEAVHDALPDMHRYMALRKKALDVDELHMYDIYVPIVPDVEMKITYPEAKALVAEALAPMGEEYVKIMQSGMDAGWMDVYENKGKTSGAYSWGIWGVHPYVLLNWSDTVDSAFTLAHELGHSMHSWYSDHAQTYQDAAYPLLLAEVASTSNEALMMDYLLKTTEDAGKKKRLLNYFLEQFRGTMFRQVMFAEFEKIVHERTQAGEALTVEDYKTIYRELNALYYGPEMVLDEEISMEWARVPHFYRSFYVYKYATGFATAISFSRMVLKDASGREKMHAFLSAGGSDDPLAILKKTGVDLEQPDTVREALRLFGELVTQMEALIA